VVLTGSGAVKLASLGLCCAARERTSVNDPEFNPALYGADPTFAAPERLLRSVCVYVFVCV